MPIPIRPSLQSEMKFLIVLAAAFATIAIASPAGVTAASPVDDVLTNNPAGHQANQVCYWAGLAPFCAGGCPPGFTETDRDPCGGDDDRCCVTGYKALCCT